MDSPWYLPLSYGSICSGKSHMPFFFDGHIWKSPGELAS